MNVIFIPADTGNPYQSLLSDSLQTLGHHVELITPTGTLPLLNLYRNMKTLEVIHLHWTDWLHASLNNRVTIMRRSLRFLAELVYLRLRGVKIVWTVHNLRNHEGKNGSIDFLINKILTITANDIIVHTDAAMKMVASYYNLTSKCAKKISIVPHGNFISTYPNNISKKDARIWLDIGSHETVFLLFGQIRPYKGAENLISTFLSLNLPGAKLIIAGRAIDEKFGEEITRTCKGQKNIKLVLEFIPPEEIQYYMKACDIVVLPYLDHLTSGVSILAMSFGRPILMPRTAITEASLDNKNNILYSLRVNGLEAALKESLEEDLVTMGEKNYLNAKSLDWDKIARMTSALYEH